MTNEERQTVINALKLGLENTRLSQSEPILRAIAIMRREREYVAKPLQMTLERVEVNGECVYGTYFRQD